MVMPRSFSSAFESIVTPSSVAPLCRSIASVSVVFPWSTWAMIAMFRISFVIKKCLTHLRRRISYHVFSRKYYKGLSDSGVAVDGRFGIGVGTYLNSLVRGAIRPDIGRDRRPNGVLARGGAYSEAAFRVRAKFADDSHTVGRGQHKTCLVLFIGALGVRRVAHHRALWAKQHLALHTRVIGKDSSPAASGAW